MLSQGAWMRLSNRKNRAPIEGRRAAAEAACCHPARERPAQAPGSGPKVSRSGRSAEERGERLGLRPSGTSHRPAASRVVAPRRRDQSRRLASSATIAPSRWARPSTPASARARRPRRSSSAPLGPPHPVIGCSRSRSPRCWCLAAAVARNWRLARLLIFLGAAVVAISLAVDAPQGLREGDRRDRVFRGEGDSPGQLLGPTVLRGDADRRRPDPCSSAPRSARCQARSPPPGARRAGSSALRGSRSRVEEART